MLDILIYPPTLKCPSNVLTKVDPIVRVMVRYLKTKIKSQCTYLKAILAPLYKPYPLIMYSLKDAPNILYLDIYIWRKVVCFVLLLWDPPNWDASNCVLGVFGKLSMRRGAWVWFHDVCTCSAKVLEYWMIFSLKIKLNRSWNFWRNWNVALVLLERS
jgi:hypothetical protein